MRQLWYFQCIFDKLFRTMECELVYSDFIYADDRYLWSMLSTLRIQGYMFSLFEVFLKLVKHKEKVKVHHNFQPGKVKSVVRLKHGRMSRPFKAGLAWTGHSYFDSLSFCSLKQLDFLVGFSFILIFNIKPKHSFRNLSLFRTGFLSVNVSSDCHQIVYPLIIIVICKTFFFCFCSEIYI